MGRDYANTQTVSEIVANDCVCRIHDTSKTNHPNLNTWKIDNMQNIAGNPICSEKIALQCYNSDIHGADADCVPIVILIIICVALAISVFYLYRKVKKMKKELDDLKRDTQINKNVPVGRNDEDVESKETNT